MASLLSTRLALKVDEAVKYLGDEPRVIAARCWDGEIPGVRINDTFWLIPTWYLRSGWTVDGEPFPAPVIPNHLSLTPEEASPLLPWSPGAIFFMLRERVLPSMNNRGRRIETKWLRDTF